MQRIVLLAALTTALLLPAAVRAQHMFLDCNGDHLSTAADRLEVGDEQKVDVWLVTDRNRDGRPTALRLPDGSGPTINSYQFVLRALGGEVAWGEYSNGIPSMNAPFVTRASRTEFTTGFGGSKILPAGSYLLGSLNVRVVSGNPGIEIVSSTSLCAGVTTSFGSAVPGLDEDNTLKFRSGGTEPVEVGGMRRGDWSEAVGIRASTGGGEFKAATQDTKLGVRVSPNPANPVAEFLVTTTRSGPIRIAIYDVRGRLVRMLGESYNLPSGLHRFALSDGQSKVPLASGVHFYRVDTEEGSVSGKILILK